MNTGQGVSLEPLNIEFPTSQHTVGSEANRTVVPLGKDNTFSQDTSIRSPHDFRQEQIKRRKRINQQAAAIFDSLVDSERLKLL